MHDRAELKARCQMGREYNEEQERRVLARAVVPIKANNLRDRWYSLGHLYVTFASSRFHL